MLLCYLFFVGAWGAVVELAIAIRRELSKFSGGNPNIHASAGIVLISNKYPLAQASQSAGNAEHQSKSLHWWKDDKEYTKDAITFLGQTFTWEKFSLGEDTVYTLMQELNEMLEENMASGPIYNLLRLYTQYQEKLAERQKTRGETETESGKPQPLWGRWMWLGYYYLTKKKETKKLAETFKKDSIDSMEKVGVATRWAMLLNRNSSVTKNEDKG